MKLNKSLLVLILIIPFTLLADVTISDEAYNRIQERLKKDKQIIEINQVRWEKLRTAAPKINYTVNKNVVTQVIEISVYKSKPLTYKVEFEIDSPEEEEVGLFPFQIFLMGMIEFTGVDAKLGAQVINFNKIIGIPLGINGVVGVRSFGGTFSYSFKKVIDNTMIHLYVGETYTLNTTYGLGVSLNF